jgi:hypothetical protein
MNGKNKILRISAISMIAFLLLSFAPQHASADVGVDLPYDWVIQVETDQLKRQFEYQGSTLNPVERLEVTWYPTKDKEKKTRYELMYYHDGRPFGMEKLHKMDIDKGDGVAIEIKHKSNNATEAEKKDAGNAIFRLALDAYLNRNPLAAVKVPVDSFDTVSEKLQALGFHDSKQDGEGLDNSEQFKSDMTISLFSVPEGKHVTLIR